MVDHTPVYPREVVKRALKLSATADPRAQPSRTDIQMTQSIIESAKP